MRIAVVSTIYKATPPVGYGGIERIVYALVEQLVRDGHDVTLFAAPGSHCSGKTIEVEGCDHSKAPCGIIKKSDIISEEPLYEAMRSYLRDHPVDIIHDWSFQNLFVLCYPEAFPFIISTCFPPLSDYKRPNLVACSNAHAFLCGGSTKYVYYGLNLNDYKFSYSKKDYFVHIAKIAKYKGQHLAVRAFRKTKEKLEMAGNIEDPLYYRIILKPLLWFSPNISYLGEIEGANNYLCGAKALIQTPRWFDAFPLVILEAFASGTPVISFSEGGIPEQIVHGMNGFLCKDTNEMADAIRNVSQINPQNCRAYAEEYFSVSRMSKEYIRLFNRVIDGESW